MTVSYDSDQAEILDGLLRAARWHVACPNEPSQGAEDLDVDDMRRVKRVIIAVEAAFDARPKFRLEQKFGHR
jgi:hypothetical protein